MLKLMIELEKLTDFLDTFNNWHDFKKSIPEDSESWTYEQGIEENELYETMISYWDALNENA